MLKVIVFDFDGVLVDSNELKRLAFYDLLSDVEGVTKELIDEVWAEIAGHFKSRFEILVAVFSRLGKSGDELERLVKGHAARYDEVVRSKIKVMGTVDGVKPMLEELSKKYNLYINSATPDFALEKTVDSLGIGNFFKGVYGKAIIGLSSQENSKELNLERIMSEEKVSGEEILFVGDGEADRIAAEAYSCRFVGVANESNGWINSEDFETVGSVAELTKLID